MKAGDAVKRDQNLVDIETDKVVLEVVAPADGVLAEITQDEGATVGADDVIGTVEAGAPHQVLLINPRQSLKRLQLSRKTKATAKSQVRPYVVC